MTEKKSDEMLSRNVYAKAAELDAAIQEASDAGLSVFRSPQTGLIVQIGRMFEPKKDTAVDSPE